MRSHNETESKRALKLGIFGGTFNPIHAGHLLIAQDALEAFDLDKVLFIPSANPPHKEAPDLAAARHRLAMVRLAICGNRRFDCSDIEIKRGGLSYTIDTIGALQKKLPRAKLYLLIGSDSLNEFHKWREANKLAGLCRVVAVLRPGERKFQFNRKRLPGLRPLTLRAHPFAVSSTEIRDRVRTRRSICYLVPEAVAKYIARHSLYRNRDTKVTC